jgi:hypothetical protein
MSHPTQLPETGSGAILLSAVLKYPPARFFARLFTEENSKPQSTIKRKWTVVLIKQRAYFRPISQKAHHMGKIIFG